MFLRLLRDALGTDAKEVRLFTEWMERHPDATLGEQVRMYTTMTNIWMRRMAAEEEEQ